MFFYELKKTIQKSFSLYLKAFHRVNPLDESIFVMVDKLFNLI